MITVAFAFSPFLTFLIWLALAAMAFWVWSGTKANATLYTMIGGALLAIMSFFGAFGIAFGGDLLMWLLVVGSALVVLGYYFTVKPVVDKHIRELKEKAKAKTASSPPSSPPPPAS